MNIAEMFRTQRAQEREAENREVAAHCRRAAEMQCRQELELSEESDERNEETER